MPAQGILPREVPYDAIITMEGQRPSQLRTFYAPEMQSKKDARG